MSKQIIARDTMGPHPAVDPFSLNRFSSHFENEIALISIDQSSVLHFANDGRHLILLYILAKLPLSQNCFVLADSDHISKGTRLLELSIILCKEPFFFENNPLY